MSYGQYSPKFRITYRRRLVRDGVHYFDILDTVENPFAAPGFPRGEVLIEVFGDQRRDVLCPAAESWPAKAIADLDAEPLESPTTFHRCRLYQPSVTVSNDPLARYLEVWDTVCEPAEYRPNWPAHLDNAVLAFTEIDFSPREVRIRVDARQALLSTANQAVRAVEMLK